MLRRYCCNSFNSLHLFSLTLLALLLAAPAFGQVFLVFPADENGRVTYGDSTQAGASDSSSYPSDDCWSDPSEAWIFPGQYDEDNVGAEPPEFLHGFPGTWHCWQRDGTAGVDRGYFFFRKGGGGATSLTLLTGLSANLDMTRPYARVHVISIGINDCGGAISNADTHDNVETLVDTILADHADNEVFFYKNPGWMMAEAVGSGCTDGQYDEDRPPTNPESLDYLFLVEYAANARVHFDTAIYENFCTGTGYPSCPAGSDVRAEFWMDGSATFPDHASPHPNSHGYNRIAFDLHEWTQEELGRDTAWRQPQPPAPALEAVSTTTTTITVRATLEQTGPEVFVWAVETDTWCGGVLAADWAAPALQADYSRVEGAPAEVTLPGPFSSGTDYKVCALAWGNESGPGLGVNITVTTQ